MSLPYTRQTPSLPSAESTLASSRVDHQPSSSTPANSHPYPLRSSPGSSLEGKTIPNPSSLGRKATLSRKTGGFLLDPAAGSDGGEQEKEQVQQRGYGYRGGLGAGLFNPELLVRSYREPMPQADEGLVIEDTDPARIVSLALASGATRKVETSRRAVQQRSASANRQAPGVGSGGNNGKDQWLGASSTIFGPSAQQGRGRATSPNRGFLMTSNVDKRRSVSTSGHSPGGGARRLSPLNPSFSPPPPPGPINPRHSYPSPLSPSPLPPSVFPYQQLQKMRGLQEQQELRELQRQYKFTEATLQRTLKAKQQLELSDLYKRLLEIYPSTDTPLAGSEKYGGVGSVNHRVYNPLMSIRNKRIRNRERIQLDLSSWEDPGAVGQWVEDVAVAVRDSIENGHIKPPLLPLPPLPSANSTKTKRSRLDWVISPQELFAEFYWIEETDRLRREEVHRNGERAKKVRREGQAKGKESQTSLKSLEKEWRKSRGSLEFGWKKRSVLNLEEDENIREPMKRDSKKRPKKSEEFHRSLLQLGSNRDGGEEFVHSNHPSSSDESGHSSESEVDYASDYSDMEVDISGPEIDTEAKRKYHRRRRKLGQIITGGKHSKKAKKKRGDAYTLDADERRKRQEQEEIEWMAEMGGRMMEPMARVCSADEEFDSAAGRNGDPKKQDPLNIATGMGVSLPNTLGGSKSSLERYENATGMPVVVGRKSVDFAEIVVPSIAISLSPPRVKPRDEEYDIDGRGRAKRKEERGKEEKRKSSPTKKFLERGQEVFVKAREGSLDQRRESLDIDGLLRKGIYKDKEKESKKNRLKGRVEKIRSEVGTKVDNFIFKRDPSGSTHPSPTGSSFTGSIGSRSDDDRIRLSRENTISASEPEDEWRSRRAWRRSSLEVPDSSRSMRTTKYKGSFPLNVLPSIASPGAPPSPVPSKAGLLQDDLAASDVNADDDLASRPYKLAPPTREYSREPSPARSVIFQATDKKRLLPGDRFKSMPPEVIKMLPKAPTLPLVSTDEEHIIIPTRNGTPENLEEPVFATRKELMMAKAYLTRSGIVARGITAKRARESGVAGIVSIARERMHSSAVVSRDINIAEQIFVRKANYFADCTAFELRGMIDRIKEDIETELMPLLTGVADGADELNEELTTTCTLAVKRVNEEVAAMARRKRRQLRWVRRGGYLLLEWVVLGVMWWVWSVVVMLNIIKGVCRGVIGAVRWILWI